LKPNNNKKAFRLRLLIVSNGTKGIIFRGTTQFYYASRNA